MTVVINIHKPYFMFIYIHNLNRYRKLFCQPYFSNIDINSLSIDIDHVGVVHIKMPILLSFTHPQVFFQTCMNVFLLLNTTEDFCFHFHSIFYLFFFFSGVHQLVTDILHLSSLCSAEQNACRLEKTKNKT